ncbi:MAG: MMPL family transporter [Microlunatus sp.]|nr:MMPL family transporter [Microlunatus sp.]
MSSHLYALGRAAYRHRVRALLAWLAALVVALGLAGGIGGTFDEKFSVPGTESQIALDSLNRTFPQAGGVTAQVIVLAPEGATVRDAAVKKQIEAGVDALGTVDRVDSVTSPFDSFAKGAISDDDQAAIIQLQLITVDGAVTDATFDGIAAETAALQASIPGSQVSPGGSAYSNDTPGFSIVEVLGVVIALVVLVLTLGSLVAAGMPLLTALLGVGITVLLIFATTGVTVVSSTTPMLAVMLGLAVGIDYALFITSRHRDQMAAGMDPEESVAQAVATAGSAVVFAGLTVMIALSGLAVAGIPFLTTMGIAAAVGVGIAVLIALTLLPALLGFAGERLRPKTPRRKRRARAETAGTEPAEPGAKTTLPRRWVRLVTKWPILTILVVVIGLGAMAYPAKDLRIALPDNGGADAGTPARVTYDLINDHFGVGYNGPLIVSATIVGSDDPLTVMDGIADDLRALPGVASVPLSTPNENAEVGIVQVIPTTAPDAQETKDLVMRIRSMHDEFQAEYGVPVYVTGFTAVAIDVSDRLGKALLPFGILVVGLSLLLLTMVFRSIAVPIKATLGYLLSVLAAFGATAMVFEYGWFSTVFNVPDTGPVISFLPILLMGILFGLAMDYEVFLVSRIREEYVHAVARAGSRTEVDPGRTIEDGFNASARVVVAAGVIMFAVFAAFVPEGEGPIKTIAFGLAVGVFVDAFLVRMTLVPAVMTLLGHRAWWLPRWIDQRLPTFDVEGAGLAHQLALQDWPSADDDHLLYADGLRVPGNDDDLGMALRPGDVAVVDGQVDSGKSALLLSLSGRMKLSGGQVKVAGLVLPEQSAAVRSRTAVIDCRQLAPKHRGRGGLRTELRVAERRDPSVIFVDHADVLTDHDDRAALASLLDETAGSGSRAVVIAARDRALVDDLVRVPYRHLTLGPVPDLADSHRN